MKNTPEEKPSPRESARPDLGNEKIREGDKKIPSHIPQKKRTMRFRKRLKAALGFQEWKDMNRKTVTTVFN